MLTRSRSKAANQPVFIDDKWNDAYIQTKDEQIDALLAADASQRGWDDLEEENSEASEDEDADAWHSDSEESEDDEADWLERPQVQPTLSFAQRWVTGGSLLQNVGWTLAVLAVAPLLLYASLPRADGQLWPLQSLRLAGTLSKVLLNVVTLGVAALALYGASCSVGVLSVNWRQVQVEPPVQCAERLLQGGSGVVQAVVEALSLGKDPTAPLRRLDEDVWTLVASLDAPVVRELAALVAGMAMTLTCFHRVWAKTLVLLTAASYVAFNVATEVKIQQRAAVEIFSLDPTFAFANESIFVAIDGQNLEEGGSVAWAPYWGGVQQQHAQACPKRFPHQLSNGGVLVTFGQVNEYVPCYLSAKDTASAVIVDGEIQPSEAFQCFESIRLRVKDQKSVPGWSLHQNQQDDEPFSAEKQEL
ncbi:hypothetical protein PRIC1_010447 [Phytophthora ramorum]